MGRLTLTQFPMVMTLSSILTVAAGFLLYLNDSSGFQINWISTLSGVTLTIGSVAGIVAFILGLTVQMPASARMAALQEEIQAAGGSPTPSQMEEMQRPAGKNFKWFTLGSGTDGNRRARHDDSAGSRETLNGSPLLVNRPAGRFMLWIIVVSGLIATLAIIGISLLGIKLSF